MANTFTQIHIQFVFGVKFRNALIDPSWEHQLHKYITGIVTNHNHKMLAINGTQDHLHGFIGMRPTQPLSTLMQMVKGESSEWINKKFRLPIHFEWQAGYGAFSYSKESVHNVCDYIARQKEHHAYQSFTAEFLALLEEFEIPFDDRYLPHEPL